MAFPEDPLEPDVSVLIDGQWEEVAAEVYTRSPISIERGRANEATAVAPSKGTLVFDNRSGDWSPRNPRSPRYGKIGRNTPLRVAVPGSTVFLALEGDAASTATTPDHSSLDIVGDVDLRVEAAGDLHGGLTTRNLIGKWVETGDQRSYLLQISTDGNLRFRWSPDGTGAAARSYTLAPPGGLPHRVALRAHLDVNDGAGGCIARMYWAPSLAGPWEQFSGNISIAGTTSVYSSTAPLSIAPTAPTSGTPSTPLNGRVYAAEVRNSSGTVVAAPDFTAQAAGATSFVDSTGKTWALTGGAEITDRRFRLHGEVPSWSPRWDVSGNDIETPVEVAGIMRRMSQGEKALDSTLRRRIPSAPGLVAYWPMEEAREATQAYSPVPGVKPMKVTGFDFAADDTLAGSSPLPKLKNPATMTGAVRASGVSGWQVEMVYLLPTLPAAQTEILRVNVGGSATRSAHVYASTAGIRVEARDGDGDVLAFFLYSNASALAAFYGSWNRLSIHTSDAGGGSTNLVATWRDVNGSGGRSFSATAFTGVKGYVTGVTGTWGAATEGMALGHLGVMAVAGSGTNPGSVYYDGADDGYNGETALSRLSRLGMEEQQIAISWVDGDETTDSERMGPQRPGSLLALLQECADADGGVLYEQLDQLALIYRDRATFYNQAPRLVLDYATDGEVAPPLEPVDDDKDIRNDRTVSRVGGSSARVVIEEGPLSVQAPPLGVGVYDDAVSLNVFSDDQTEQIAGWRAHLGTWDEARYPSVHVNLAAAPHLIDQVLGLDIGDLIRINNLPSWMPPGPVDLIIQGYAEVIDQYAWDITFNCTPAGPWNVAVVGVSKADTAGSELSAGVDADDTVLPVITTQGPQWVDASMLFEFPFDIRAGGEVMTVQQITGLVQDTFARTVATGWGTATSGQTWTTTGGSAADFSVQGA